MTQYVAEVVQRWRTKTRYRKGRLVCRGASGLVQKDTLSFEASSLKDAQRTVRSYVHTGHWLLSNTEARLQRADDESVGGERKAVPLVRRLPTIAKDITESHPELKVQMKRGFASGDRKIPGTRLRNPGRHRYGNRLVITDSKGRVLVDHNSVEAYRSNDEVEKWLAEYRRERGDEIRVTLVKRSVDG